MFRRRILRAPTTLTELNAAKANVKADTSSQTPQNKSAAHELRRATSFAWLYVMALALVLMAAGFLRGRYESPSGWKASS